MNVRPLNDGRGVEEEEEEMWHLGYNIMFSLYFLHHLPVGSN